MADSVNRLDGSASGPVIQARDIGGVHLHAPPPYRPPAPRQLPPPPRWWVDRERELAELDRLMDHAQGSGPAVAVLHGPPGVGTTALATTWLTRRAEPHRWAGCLYGQLGPSTADDACAWIGRWLRALGVPPPAVPADPHELAGLWRTVTAFRPVAILLDVAVDAGDDAQVRRLVPGAGPSCLVITSRTALPGLGGIAVHVRVPPLDEHAATDLLQRLMGPPAGEPDWLGRRLARQIARRTGGLPQTLTALAAHTAAPELMSDLGRHGVGPHTQIDVTVSLDLAYARLTPPADRLYQVMSLHPGEEFGVGVAAAAMNADEPTAERLLQELADAGLMTRHGDTHDGGRWAYPRLAVTHALKLADELSAEDRELVRDRMVGYYVTMTAAARAATGYLNTDLPAADRRFTGLAEALAWLEREHRALVAVARWADRRGRHAQALRIVHGMWPLHLHHRPPSWIDTDEVGLRAARADGDLRGEASMLDRLGHAHQHAGNHQEALDYFTSAERIWNQLGDPHKAAGSVRRLAGLAAAQGYYDAAIQQYGVAAERHTALGETRHTALALHGLGQAQVRARRPRPALEALDRAWRLFGECEPADPYNQARTRITLAAAQAQLGDQAAALAHLTAAVGVMQELGSRHGEAVALDALAELAARSGDAATAHKMARRAEALRCGAPQP